MLKKKEPPPLLTRKTKIIRRLRYRQSWIQPVVIDGRVRGSAFPACCVKPTLAPRGYFINTSPPLRRGRGLATHGHGTVKSCKQNNITQTVVPLFSMRTAAENALHIQQYLYIVIVIMLLLLVRCGGGKSAGEEIPFGLWRRG